MEKRFIARMIPS